MVIFPPHCVTLHTAQAFPSLGLTLFGIFEWEVKHLMHFPSFPCEMDGKPTGCRIRKTRSYPDPIRYPYVCYDPFMACITSHLVVLSFSLVSTVSISRYFRDYQASASGGRLIHATLLCYFVTKPHEAQLSDAEVDS
jgi:hypothetical protein